MAGGHDDVRTVGLEVELRHALLHAEGGELFVKPAQGVHRHAAQTLVLLLGQAVELVDVAAGAHDVDAGVRLRQGGEVALQALPLRVGHGPVEHAHGAHVVGTAAHELPFRQQIDLRAASAHVDIHVVAPTVAHVGEVVVVDDARLLLSVDDFHTDARLPGDASDDGRTVAGVAHG